VDWNLKFQFTYKRWIWIFITWRKIMQISYKKLWKLLIDRDMLKKDLGEKAEISSTSIAKLSKNENVNTEILRKICSALECDVSDIMEMVDDKSDRKGETE
jgi:DNA-binding Xre family transcriptional regulator